MISNELLGDIQKLDRTDKVHVIQILAGDLASEEEETYFRPDAAYEVWSPFDALLASEILLKILVNNQM